MTNRKIAEIIYNSIADMDYMDYEETIENDIEELTKTLIVLEKSQDYILCYSPITENYYKFNANKGVIL